MERLGFHWREFHEILYVSFFFRNSVEKNHVSLIPKKIKDTLHEDISTFMIISRCILLGMEHFVDKICKGNQKKITYSNFSPKIVFFMRWYGKMWWNRTGHIWHYNTEHALWLLGNSDHRHTIRIRVGFRGNIVYSNALHCYFTRTLPVLCFRLLLSLRGVIEVEIPDCWSCL